MMIHTQTHKAIDYELRLHLFFTPSLAHPASACLSPLSALSDILRVAV